MARAPAPLNKLARSGVRLQEVFEKAWMLGDDAIEAARPGDEAGLAELLSGRGEDPLARLAGAADPHRELLRLMREPRWFPFTCQTLFNVQILPFQHVVLQQLWTHQFPMLVATRGGGKSFILALYAMLRCLFRQGTKVVICGAAFRQAKVVFEYVEMLWANAPVLRDLCGGGRGRNNREQGPRRDIDRCECIIGESIIIALPLGDGKKIRGQRANIIIADEFASINPDIYERVIKGFGAVTQDPVENVVEEARVRLMKKLGYWTDEMDLAHVRPVNNQSIIAGTADYAFNWFADYWARHRAIVLSGGDPRKLAELSKDGEADPDLDWRDYVVLRLPSELLPPGFMDRKTIASSRAMSSSSNFLTEYGATFCRDSDGFFKMSLIEACVAGGRHSAIPFRFSVAMRGEPGVEHIIGIDPASQRDNFAIVVLALRDGHRRVVYCWTTRKKEFLKRKREKATDKHKFYDFVARKIRDIMKAFPCGRLVMDAQGGGDPGVAEALEDPDGLLPGEEPIYPVIDPEDRKDTDGLQGLHILELVQFADAAWTSEANHGLKRDLEQHRVLFPHLDSAQLGLAVEQAKKDGQLYDTLDDAAVEVEELKRELATIVHSQTDGGRERWDVPKIKGQEHGKGRLRKDRYSALLMANAAARREALARRPAETQAAGGWATDLAREGFQDDSPMYVLGQGWVEMDAGWSAAGKAVRRGGVRR